MVWAERLNAGRPAKGQKSPFADGFFAPKVAVHPNDYHYFSLISAMERPRSTTYLARITAADREAARLLVDNFPTNSHEKWLQLQAKESANWKKSGWEVILVDFSADNFVQYCRETGASPKFHTLRGIASAKAIGKYSSRRSTDFAAEGVPSFSLFLIRMGSNSRNFPGEG